MIRTAPEVVSRLSLLSIIRKPVATVILYLFGRTRLEEHQIFRFGSAPMNVSVAAESL
jgi:hypothetical protein